MTDTYLTISEIAAHPIFSQRVTACASQQGAPDPPNWTLGHRWQIASTPGFAMAVDSWRAAQPKPGDPQVPENPEIPDYDPDGWASEWNVITDQMILAAVQPMIIGPIPDTVPDGSSNRQQRLAYLFKMGVSGVDALSDDELLDLIRDLADTP